MTYWINSATGAHVAQTFNANTDNATGNATIGARTDGTFPLDNAYHRLYSFAMGNEYLDDAKASAIIAHLEARHGRSYVP
jgi:hypothetical protein